MAIESQHYKAEALTFDFTFEMRWSCTLCFGNDVQQSHSSSCSSTLKRLYLSFLFISAEWSSSQDVKKTEKTVKLKLAEIKWFDGLSRFFRECQCFFFVICYFVLFDSSLFGLFYYIFSHSSSDRFLNDIKKHLKLE